MPPGASLVQKTSSDPVLTLSRQLVPLAGYGDPGIAQCHRDSACFYTQDAYNWFSSGGEAGFQFWLFTIYHKDEMDDLTPAQRKEGAMKTARRRRAVRTRKRDLFKELSEGVQALAEARHGKRTLRTHAVDFKPAPEVAPAEIVRLREDLNISRAVFAAYLRTNLRTLENWEQGRAKPNAQAALLIRLVKRYPDTVQRLAAI